MLMVLLCWRVPKVAVTETIEVNGLKLEQPVVIEKTATTIKMTRAPRYFLRRRATGAKRQNAATRPPLERPQSIAVEVVVASLAAVMVRVLMIAEPEGVSVAGLNEQVTPTGNPVHPRVTVELKPLSGVTVIVAVPVEPRITVMEELFRPEVKSVLVKLNCAVVEKPGTVATTL